MPGPPAGRAGPGQFFRNRPFAFKRTTFLGVDSVSGYSLFRRTFFHKIYIKQLIFKVKAK